MVKPKHPKCAIVLGILLMPFIAAGLIMGIMALAFIGGCLLAKKLTDWL